MKFFFLISLVFLLGCNAEQAGVQINTSGIFAPVTFSVNGQDASGKTLDFGEHLLTDDPLSVIVKVHNKTLFPYTNLDLVLSTDGDSVPSIQFVPTETGEIKFPGQGGTCETTLGPGEACEIHLTFSPRESRFYSEILTLNFRNYVDPETHVANIKMIAGMPASLAFTNDVTQYTFGDLIGVAKLPVVERADALVYNKELEIVNAGGLPAKNLNVILTQTCTSALTGSCPSGMNGAFSMTTSCPLKLYPGEKCKVHVSYQAKNQDPASGPIPPEIKEINYKATVNFAYIKDPRNSSGALNGYFKSTSTNIEARFKVPITTLSFENPIVSGNRDSRTFRISNLGFREGHIKSLDFRDIGGALLGSCKAHATSPYLECRNGSNAILPLSSFPFTIKDRNECLTTPTEAPKYIEVGEGCVFDLLFQPSVTYLTDRMTEFLNIQPEVIYDSRWKGNETITTNKLFSLSAKSKAAARLVLERVRYDITSYTSAGDSPWEINLGRLTLQSPNFFKRKLIIMTFKNIGSVEATNLSFKDASGRIINVGNTGVDLGARSPYYYTSAIATESNCTIVAPNDTCSLAVMFAPIGMDTNAEEDANMFDATGTDGKRYKGFQLTYKSGASYTDTNLDADPDYAPLTVETRLKAQLIRKGMLMQLSDDKRNVGNFGGNANVAGDTVVTHLYVQNIGTGPVPYFRLMNPPATTNKTLTLLPTPDPVSLGAEYDCLAIGDEDSTNTVPGNASPTSRVGNFSSLPKEESCVYTIQMKSPDSLRYHNAISSTNSLPAATSTEEGTRFFSREAEAAGGSALWEFGYNGIPYALQYQNIRIRYYDGDSTDPAAASSYGNLFSLVDYNLMPSQARPAKLIPHSFLPFLSATLYRPGFTYPSLSATQPSFIIPETWFYGTGQTYSYVLNDPAQSSPVMQGDDSRNFVPTLAGFANRGNYDYVYYIGSFPQGSGAFSFNMGLRNFGGFAARLKSYYATPDPAFTINAIPTTFPMTIPNNSDVGPLSFSFNPAVQGEHWMELEYQYEPGTKTQPLIYKSNAVPSNLATVGKEVINQKILVIGHVMQTGTFPQLSLNVQDYEVTQNEGIAPTETILEPYNVPLSWNTFTAPRSLVFDTIKLTAAPKISDVYAKKKFIFTNNSLNTLLGLRLLYRPDVGSSSTKGVSATFTTVTSGTTCTNNMNLAPGASCSVILRYQPGRADTTDNFIMTMLYSSGPGQYLMQNTGITLFPKAPGQVIALNRATENINYKVGPTTTSTTRTSYPLNFGTTTLNEVPKVFSFNTSSGTFQKIQLVNRQPTKASLLLAYHKYLSANSLRGYSSTLVPPTSTVPQESEYRLHDGFQYAKIYSGKYSDGSERHVIEATRGCFFGDDENNAAIPQHQKGFNDTTTTPCYIIVSFNLNFEYLLKTIAVNNGDDMRGSAAEIWYYSVNRSSTASLWVHVKGVVNPDISVASGAYSNVWAYDNKTTSFSVPKFNPGSSSVGDIIGIRVLLSSSPTGLNNPYATNLTSYFDIRPYDAFSTQFANFVSGLSNGQFFYFRAVAIRKDTRFVDGTPKRFVGLNPGEYLSGANNLAAPLKVLIPPLNHFYFHNQKMVVDKFMTGGILNEPYGTSSNRCTTRTRLLIKDPSNLYYSYQLIRKSTWDLLLATPAATGYTNMSQISHWLNEPTVSINSVCSSLPGYLAGQTTQMLDSSAVFYIRNGSNPLANVNQAIGGVPGTTNSNYRSYVDGAIGFASARCMVVLP